MPNILPTAASLLLSEKCNLKCKYCFERGTRDDKNGLIMPDEVIIDSIGFLYDNAIKNRMDNEVELLLFGGEPMLNFDGVKCALETGLAMNDRCGHNFRSVLVTNATILPDRAYEVFPKFGDLNKLKIQISVDGTKKFHDAARTFHDGSGSFDIIEKNVLKYVDIFGG